MTLFEHTLYLTETEASHAGKFLSMISFVIKNRWSHLCKDKKKIESCIIVDDLIGGTTLKKVHKCCYLLSLIIKEIINSRENKIYEIFVWFKMKKIHEIIVKSEVFYKIMWIFKLKAKTTSTLK